MMERLSLVINALENCTAPQKCRECYWKECEEDHETIKVPLNLAKAALELLKAQEPRVIDADEIVLTAEPSGWLWVEVKDDYCVEAFRGGKTISGRISFDCEAPCAFLYDLRPDEYGKTWRCWTSRPSDVKREATPWIA